MGLSACRGLTVNGFLQSGEPLKNLEIERMHDKQVAGALPDCSYAEGVR